MKYACLFATLFTAALAAPAFAGDGRVPTATLNRLGLSRMTVLSDEEGQSVRGMSGNAMAMGTSLVSGVLIDPATKSFVFGTSLDGAMSSAENAGLQVLTVASISHASSVALSLDVDTLVSSFSGVLIGGAGGNAAAGSQ